VPPPFAQDRHARICWFTSGGVRRCTAVATEAPDALERTRSLLAFLEEAGYKARLVDLARDADGVVPGIVGTVSRWANAVSDARNEYAHRSKQRWLDDPHQRPLGRVPLTSVGPGPDAAALCRVQ
jgi:hypothetical protein